MGAAPTALPRGAGDAYPALPGWADI